MESQPSSPDALDRQVRDLLQSMETVFRALMARRPPVPIMEVEMSHQQMRALIVIGRRGALTMSELATLLDIPLSTATHTVDKLVDKELVERLRPPDNRRTVQVELSPKGKQTHEGIAQARASMARGMLESLSPGEREIFLELNAKMARSQLELIDKVP